MRSRSAPRETGQEAYLTRLNILMRSCFKLLFYTLAAALCVWGAGPEEVQRVKTVVRVDARSGKLVRTVVSNVHSVAGALALPPLDAAVRRIAAEQSLPPELLHSVIQV